MKMKLDADWIFCTEAIHEVVQAAVTYLCGITRWRYLPQQIQHIFP